MSWREGCPACSTSLPDPASSDWRSSLSSSPELRVCKESRRLLRRLVPIAQLPAIRSDNRARHKLNDLRRSQFAVPNACQIPFRLGWPSKVRGIFGRGSRLGTCGNCHSESSGQHGGCQDEETHSNPHWFYFPTSARYRSLGHCPAARTRRWRARRHESRTPPWSCGFHDRRFTGGILHPFDGANRPVSEHSPSVTRTQRVPAQRT